MKKIILSVFATLVFLAAPQSIASAQTPFGGQIIAMWPCYYPWGGWQILLGPPTPGVYLYQMGFSLSYLFGPPLHPGQYILGSSVGIGACASYYNDGWRGWQSGGLILFHGSSA